MAPFLGAGLLLLAAPPFWPGLALGVGLLLVARRVFPEGFLGWAFVPGVLVALGKPLALGVPQGVLVSGLLLLYGLFLSAKAHPLAPLFLLPPALALGPMGLFLLGVLHGVNLLEEAWKEAKARNGAFHAPPQALALPFLLGLGLWGLSFLPLPHFSLPVPIGPNPALGGEASAAGGGEVVYGAPEGGLPLWALWLDRLLPYALPLALPLLLLALLPLLGRGGRLPYRGGHVLPLLLALLAFGLLFLYLGTLGGGEEGSAGTSPLRPVPLIPEPSQKELVPGPKRLAETGLALAGLSALLTLGLLLGLGLFLWRSRPKGAERAEDQSPSKGPRAFRKPLPEDRVRRAYALALRALGRAGLPHLPHEGPLEYQRRVQGLFPEAQGPLGGLTRLYLPVRYGGRLGEEDAAQAEVFLEDILRLCSWRASKRP